MTCSPAIRRNCVITKTKVYMCFQCIADLCAQEVGELSALVQHMAGISQHRRLVGRAAAQAHERRGRRLCSRSTA